MTDYKNHKIGTADLICIAIGITLGGYLADKYVIPYTSKLHDKIVQTAGKIEDRVNAEFSKLAPKHFR